MRDGDGQGRAGLAALDLGQHRRAHAAAVGQVAQRQALRLAQRANTRAHGAMPLVSTVSTGTGVRYHVRLYARSFLGRRPAASQSGVVRSRYARSALGDRIRPRS